MTTINTTQQIHTIYSITITGERRDETSIGELAKIARFDITYGIQEDGYQYVRIDTLIQDDYFILCEGDELQYDEFTSLFSVSTEYDRRNKDGAKSAQR